MVTLSLTAGFALGGPLLELVGPRAAYAIGGVGGLVGAIVLLPVLRASRDEARDELVVVGEAEVLEPLRAAG
jgi:predicted MFS family arabinose efflux permease